MQPDWYREGIAHIWQPYAQAKVAPAPLPVAFTEGCSIILQDGRRLIDGISSWWCIPHGYNHPHLLEAARKQLELMPNVMFAGLAHEPAYRLAARLSVLTGLERVFFSDSGSTAVEVALKIALQYWVNVGHSSKTHFACLEHAYHGDTFGAMGVSDPVRGMHKAYLSNVREATALPVPDNEEKRALFCEILTDIAGATAALIVEPLVQGAGGIRFHTTECLKFMADCCREHNILLIADEIMTGFGRTGSMFACEQANIKPDILCLGKGLTGGVMTLAATLATDTIWQAFYDDDLMKALMHGPTFMANPLACAIANASLDLFETQPRLEQVKAIETQCQRRLLPVANISYVKDVRIKGAIAAIQIDKPDFNPFTLRPRFVELGCWLRPYKDIIYLMPPFTVSESELAHLLESVIEVVETL